MPPSSFHPPLATPATSEYSQEMGLLGKASSFAQRVSTRLRVMQQGQLPSFALYLPFVAGKSGIEIGGPSRVFQPGRALPVYRQIGTLDNCDFSKSTVWAKHSEDFFFNPEKAPGKTFFCDGSALDPVPGSSYDVVLSAHNLEHFANPVKALKEWWRVLKPNGALVLVLPDYRKTFDHRREPTAVDHMFRDYEQNTGEEDLTHLPEILARHDLQRDPGAGSREAFQQRAQDNFSNRCMHHHVFDERNSAELLSRSGYDVLAADLAVPFDICLLARKNSARPF